MPYEWSSPQNDAHLLRLWPYRSLEPAGFVWFIAITSALIALPLITVIGKPVLWGLLPFVVAAVAGIWWALQRSSRDRLILEELRLSRDRVTLTRQGPHGRVQEWQADPYWVRVTVHARGGPVPDYVTLRGNGREVEIGAFLSQAERLHLGQDLQTHLAALR